MLTLPQLPYRQSALAPHVSERTLQFHYGKHHAAYVSKANGLIKDTPLAEKSLLEIIQTATGDANKSGLFNNAAQIWNHTFFWNSMSPSGGGAPSGTIGKRIEADFGSYDQFREAFVTAATTQFGSGWAWLVEDKGKLAVTKTANADTPMVHAQKPLLTLDVWEHAYYLDYQNRRLDFVNAFLDNLINWEFAERNL
ncbi:MAG TPA: superoxide dismutase [Candidatus Polarisedimenticolia bacterium]|nr:superoxide dismutase [Candidatus Polarisedimenticolia bacterium]